MKLHKMAGMKKMRVVPKWSKVTGIKKTDIGLPKMNKRRNKVNWRKLSGV